MAVTSHTPAGSIAIHRALRSVTDRRRPGPEASGYMRDPESPTLTAPPSLPAVRVGTLHVLTRTGPRRSGVRPLLNRRAILPIASLYALSARGRPNGTVYRRQHFVRRVYP